MWNISSGSRIRTRCFMYCLWDFLLFFFTFSNMCQSYNVRETNYISELFLKGHIILMKKTYLSPFSCESFCVYIFYLVSWIVRSLCALILFSHSLPFISWTFMILVSFPLSSFHSVSPCVHHSTQNMHLPVLFDICQILLLSFCCFCVWYLCCISEQLLTVFSAARRS